MKSYTDLEQSKKLAEILPIESADIILTLEGNSELTSYPIMRNYSEFYNYLRTFELEEKYIKRTYIPAWSLAALLKYLSKIKPHVYTPILFPNESKWILQFAEYGHGNVCEVSCDNLIDACYEMIIKLHEQKLL